MTLTGPSGWRQVELRDLVTELEAGVSVNSDDRPVRPGELGVLKTSAVTTGTFDPSQHKAVVERDLARVATPVLRDRIVMSRMNTAALVGASGYVERDAPGIYLPDRLWQFGTRPDVADARWLAYVLGSREVRRLLTSAATGTSGSMKNLTKEQVRSLRVLVPPVQEQREIAASLKAADDAVAAGEAVVEQLFHVRREVVETLLTRGLPHRRYGMKRTVIGSLPESWDLKLLSDVGQVQTGLAKGKAPVGETLELPYLRVANVQDGHVDLDEMKTIVVESSALERYRVRAGDVLFTEGGDFDKLGRGCVWRGQIDPCLHQNHVFAVRTNEELLPDFLAAHAASRRGRAYFLNCAKRTTNLASINSTQLKALPVPLPPLDEQQAIAGVVGAVTDRIESERVVVAERRRVRAALADALLSGRLRVRDAA